MPEVSQSTVVVGALLAAFVIWLAVNNRLGVYYNVVVGGGGSTAPAPAGGPAATVLNPPSVANPAGSLADWLAKLGPQVGGNILQWLGLPNYGAPAAPAAPATGG